MIEEGIEAVMKKGGTKIGTGMVKRRKEGQMIRMKEGKREIVVKKWKEGIIKTKRNTRREGM